MLNIDVRSTVEAPKRNTLTKTATLSRQDLKCVTGNSETNVARRNTAGWEEGDWINIAVPCRQFQQSIMDGQVYCSTFIK